MIRAVFVLLLTSPAFLYAETGSRQEFSFLSSFLQMIAALSIVVGLILITRHFSGKLLKGIIPNQQNSKHIRIVETRYLNPKKSLIIAEVGGEYFLLASTDTGITLLKDVSIIEEIEVLDEPVSLREGLSSMFRPKADGQKELHGNS